VAELKPSPSYICKSLSKQNEKEKGKFGQRKYDFDVFKVEIIFYILLKDGQIVLIDEHKFPIDEQRKGQRYCKCHHTYGHWTNNYIHFRDLIQKAIKEGRLKFEEQSKIAKT